MEYETIFLLDINLMEKEQKEILNKVVECISKNGNIISIQEIGRKTLSYPIKKQKEAYYYQIDFEADNQCASELEHIYRTTDGVLKFMTLKNK